MCDFMTLAGLALSAGGAFASSAANDAAMAERERAQAAERQRQAALDREAAALNDASEQRYQNFEGQQGETTKKLADYFTGVQNQAAVPAPVEGLPGSTASNSVVAQEAAKQKAKTTELIGQQNQAKGALTSFGDLLGQNSLLQARDASKIGQIGNFKQGSSAVLPLELEAANDAGSGLKTLGSILSGVGSIGTAAGLRGGSLSSLFGATPFLSSGAKIAPTALPGGAAPNPFSIY